jgi:hypothetical protein
MNVKQNIAQILGSGLTKVCAIFLLTKVARCGIMEISRWYGRQRGTELRAI